MRSGTEILPAQEKELRTYAEAFGRVRTVAAWKDRRGRLHLELTGECVQRILRSQEGFTSGLGALMHVTLTKPETQYDSGGMRLMFREQEPYYITVGIGTRTREGQQISGDCVRYFTTEEGMACVILSDGMGSGEQAREESESTVRMAERFLRAGISAADCVRTIGPALKLRTQGKKFVTLDISTIDLFTGEAVSVKCGAAPSFVRAADGDDSARAEHFVQHASGGAGRSRRYGRDTVPDGQSGRAGAAQRRHCGCGRQQCGLGRGIAGGQREAVCAGAGGAPCARGLCARRTG